MRDMKRTSQRLRSIQTSIRLDEQLKTSIDSAVSKITNLKLNFIVKKHIEPFILHLSINERSKEIHQRLNNH